jgi:hypothetical protein
MSTVNPASPRRRTIDPLSTRAKRRATFRRIRGDLKCATPAVSINACRLLLQYCLAGDKSKWFETRRLSDPGPNGWWLPQTTLNAIIAALRDAKA